MRASKVLQPAPSKQQGLAGAPPGTSRPHRPQLRSSPQQLPRISGEDAKQEQQLFAGQGLPERLQISLLARRGQPGTPAVLRASLNSTHAQLQAAPWSQRPAARSSLRSGFWLGVDVPRGFALTPRRLCLEELWSCGIYLSNCGN